MTSHDARQYHLLELEIALSARDPRRIMPEIPRSTQRLLDVGCGAGQTILGLQLGPDVEAVGIDPDNDAVSLGRSWTASAQLVCGRGESLPFPDASFDFVMSRVALPYTNLPEATREIGRVLR